MSILDERLKSLRKAKSLSQNALAKVAGIEPRTYNRYELGDRVPRLEHLTTLADFYNTSIDYLVGRTDDPTPPVPPIQQSMSERG